MLPGSRPCGSGSRSPPEPATRRSFPVVNSILRSVADAHPDTSRYVDTWHLLDSPRGKYTPYLRLHGQLTRADFPDGVHYTAAGGDLVVQAILGEIDRLYALNLP